MTTLTIRIDEHLKKKAFKKAAYLGLPLTLVVKNALREFILRPRIVIGETEEIEVDSGIQKKMDRIALVLNKSKRKKKC